MKRYVRSSHLDITYILDIFPNSSLNDNEVIDSISFGSKEDAYTYISEKNVKHWELISQYWDDDCGLVAEIEDNSTEGGE